MKTIKTTNGYSVIQNNKNTFMITDEYGDCIGYFGTERKALNALARTLKCAGLA